MRPSPPRAQLPSVVSRPARRGGPAWAALMAVGLLAAGCASGATSNAEPHPGGTRSSAGGSRELQSPAKCLDVSDSVLDQIATGTRPGQHFAPLEGAAVMAREGVYTVAIRFDGSAAEAQVGVWTVTRLKGVVAPLLVADVTSSAVTTWSRVDEFPQFGVPLDSPYLQAARDCLS